MKLLHISDTHGYHHQITSLLSPADVIVHSGDFTQNGEEEEAFDFMNWLCDLPYRYKIFIAGNHDLCLFGTTHIQGLPDDVCFLYNSGIEIDGFLFYGLSYFVEDCITGIHNIQIQNIPQETDILITHQPPLGILDYADYGLGANHQGDPVLAKRVREVKPIYHFFGHEHDTFGTIKVGETVFLMLHFLIASIS